VVQVTPQASAPEVLPGVLPPVLLRAARQASAPVASVLVVRAVRVPHLVAVVFVMVVSVFQWAPQAFDPLRVRLALVSDRGVLGQPHLVLVQQ